MSKTRSFKRHLNPAKVWLANQVAEEKIKIARQVVLDRAKKDAAFAADVLKAVGDALPKEIKEACEESVSREKIPVTVEQAHVLADEISDLKSVSSSSLSEAWHLLPEDPLLVGNAPKSDYPENQGMGNALAEADKPLEKAQ
jgi:hypothetical protein